ncbi:hypothetical protein UlMin_004232 [Ulmus minor]
MKSYTFLFVGKNDHMVTKYDFTDFTYMKYVQNATSLPSKEEYDYIVIGGGTAGCPLAATLSQTYKVLLLERGSAPLSHPNVLHLKTFLSTLEQEDDGKTTPAQRFTSEDGVANVRGRILGGSSMLNMGFYSRADEQFYKDSGIEWDFDFVKKAYEWVEETIVSVSELRIWQSAMKEALLEGGVGPDIGFSLDHSVGTKVSGSTFDEVGRRHGAVELLNRGEAKNLRVVVDATVERILFSSKASKLSAIGVMYSDSNNKFHKAFVSNKGEVILTAGAIGSPQLLLLSGVGPKPYLSSLQIRTVHHQPYIGKSMADNPRNNINFITPFPLQPSYLQVVGITNDSFYIESPSFTPQFSFTSEPFTIFPNHSSPLNLSVANIAAKIGRPLSNGSLWLASPTDVKSNPIVRFNYFEHPADLARCVSGMRKVGDVLKTKTMDRFGFKNLQGEKGFIFLGPSLPKNYELDDSSMEEFCRSSVTTFWHYHGGCSVGKVVDGDFRVMGINKLRVVDGSIFTVSPGTNPQATLMMMGR